MSVNNEVSLTKIIKVVRPFRKKIIVSSMVIAVLSLSYNFVIVKPKYEAVSSIRLQMPNEGENTNFLNNYAVSAVQGIRIQSLLQKASQSDINVEDLKKRVKSEVIENSNVMEISVTTTDPVLSSRFANILAFETASRIEASDRTDIIVKTKVELENIEASLKVKLKEQTEIQQQLSSVPQFFTTRKALGDDSVFHSAVTEGINQANKKELELITESINPLYDKLNIALSDATLEVTRLSEQKKVLEDRIKENAKIIEEIDNRLFDKDQEFTIERMNSGYKAVFINPALQPTVPDRSIAIYSSIILMLLGFVVSTLFYYARHVFMHDQE
jgi:capsular polysaccharide biosynthesis protein